MAGEWEEVPPLCRSSWAGSITRCSVAGSGISSYADNPAGAGASLKPCLAKAMTVIPAEQQGETPTYLGATAGMRLLRYGHCLHPCTPTALP